MEIKEFIIAHKKQFIAYLVAIVMLFILYFVLFCGQGNNGNTTAEIVRNSEQTTEHIRNSANKLETIKQGIGASQKRIDNVQERIDDSKSRINKVIDNNRGSQELVGESIKLSKEARAILEGLPKSDGEKSKSGN